MIVRSLLVVLLVAGLSGCGKTKDAIQKVLNDVVNVPMSVYDDTQDNVKTTKDAVMPAQDSTGK